MGQFWFVSLSCDSIYIVTVDEKYQQVTSGDLLPPQFPPPQSPAPISKSAFRLSDSIWTGLFGQRVHQCERKWIGFNLDSA